MISAGYWFFGIWFIGYLITFIGLLWICIKSGKITLADLGVGVIISIFSWVSVLVWIMIEGKNIIIWEKHE